VGNIWLKAALSSSCQSFLKVNLQGLKNCVICLALLMGLGDMIC
jgi:hypothetical protein